jgi:hypothetical protein
MASSEPVKTEKCEMFGRANLSMWNALGKKKELCGVKPKTTV